MSFIYVSFSIIKPKKAPTLVERIVSPDTPPATVLDAVPASSEFHNSGVDDSRDTRFIGAVTSTNNYIDSSRLDDSRDSQFVPDCSWLDRTHAGRSSMVDDSATSIDTMSI
jgi:hypothetical protein